MYRLTPKNNYKQLGKRGRVIVLINDYFYLQNCNTSAAFTVNSSTKVSSS